MPDRRWTSEGWRALAEIRNREDERYVVSQSVRNRANVDDAIPNAGEPLSAYLGFELRLE